MKIKEGFVLRTIMGEHVIVAEGPEHIHFNKMIVMNPSAALLWKSVEDKDFSCEDLAGTLVENYEVDYEQALADATSIANNWMEDGIVGE